MPRSTRLLLNNVCYHIITRANHAQEIFLNIKDFNTYLKILQRYKLKYKFQLYAYCLMRNHVHLIMEPSEPEKLSKIMQGISQSYSIYFNKRYHKTGHLWQERFKSMVINKDQYLLNCLNYIEMNPIRAGIIKDAHRYRWSSYRYRMFGYKNSLLDSPDIL
jgi:putative transposase